MHVDDSIKERMVKTKKDIIFAENQRSTFFFLVKDLSLH